MANDRPLSSRAPISTWTLPLLLAACGEGGASDEAGTTGDDATDSASAVGDASAEDSGSSGAASVDGGSTGDGPVPEGLPCDMPFDYQGHAGCQAIVEGLEVKFFPPPAGERVDRLAIYLHGDGAADYMENWAFSSDIFAWTEPRNTMIVGVLSPAFYEDGTVAFGAAQPEHAEQVALTIEAFIAAYEPQYADQSLYWGVSGGSWFFASSFIAHVGHRVPGVFAASCGGSGFSFGWAWDPMTDTATRDAIPIYFNYGTEDFLAPNIIDSIAEFEGMGFEVDSLAHQGAMHCDHPISEPTLEFWSRYVP